MENNLGLRWQEGVNTWEKDVQEFEDVFLSYEDTAQEVFAELRSKTIPEIIKKSIENDRASFSVPVKFYLIDTQAYRDFREWASSQSLKVQVFGRLNDNKPEEQDELVLMFVPS